MRGFEPPTLGTTIQCSNQLSYIHHVVVKRLASMTEVPNVGKPALDYERIEARPVAKSTQSTLRNKTSYLAKQCLPKRGSSLVLAIRAVNT